MQVSLARSVIEAMDYLLQVGPYIVEDPVLFEVSPQADRLWYVYQSVSRTLKKLSPSSLSSLYLPVTNVPGIDKRYLVDSPEKIFQQFLSGRHKEEVIPFVFGKKAFSWNGKKGMELYGLCKQSKEPVLIGRFPIYTECRLKKQKEYALVMPKNAMPEFTVLGMVKVV